ncbi:trypsin-like cysteine/serine peptidase domain-containing protein [Durotheca rogersii]|uniref:trypsin-like cysteine/serine peptidase domain-containing protein n=1 Tax=Durotheca rogersii TaxID=419775 RepID=UPI002220385D|nr:trypsin-like cysteine/serine peptidase domain-containing protein [Durotheca rogersii]KAI5866298.1 trypsin-like cysteine/serine peptidase domain-containing protein [Durotheca rogersii]
MFREFPRLLCAYLLAILTAVARYIGQNLLEFATANEPLFAIYSEDGQEQESEAASNRGGFPPYSDRSGATPTHGDNGFTLPFKGAVLFELRCNSQEAALGKNKMTEIPQEDFSNGQAPRGVVKILVEQSSGHTSEGSGFFVADRVVATTGHVLFDPINGPAARVTVLASTASPVGYDRRYYGACCAIHQEWYDCGTYSSDLGFVLLSQDISDRKFILGYKPTPVSEVGHGTDAVVYGYTSEFRKDSPNMYLLRSHSTVHFTRDWRGRQIMHEADTLPGHSGSPVIDVLDNKVIGLHVGHASWGAINRAIAIDHYANDFDVFVHILNSVIGKRPPYVTNWAGPVSLPAMGRGGGRVTVKIIQNKICIVQGAGTVSIRVRGVLLQWE